MQVCVQPRRRAEMRGICKWNDSQGVRFGTILVTQGTVRAWAWAMAGEVAGVVHGFVCTELHQVMNSLPTPRNRIPMRGKVNTVSDRVSLDSQDIARHSGAWLHTANRNVKNMQLFHVVQQNDPFLCASHAARPHLFVIVETQKQELVTHRMLPSRAWYPS